MELPDYPNYLIYDDGHVYSKTRSRSKGRFLIQSLSGTYKTVALYNDGKRRTMLVHRLVAAAFLPNPNNYPVVHHKDGDRTNNHVSNLEWCSQMYNTQYVNTLRTFGHIWQDKCRSSYRVRITLNKKVLNETFGTMQEAQAFRDEMMLKVIAFNGLKRLSSSL